MRTSFRRPPRWQAEFDLLRAIIQDCGLQETVKWGWPCYTDQGRNIALIHGFKDYCAILFFKGALLRDPHGLLVRQTRHVQAARQLRFTGCDTIRELAPIIQAYVREAVEVERAGAKVPPADPDDLPVPPELQAKFEELPALRVAFEALTPGRRRGYLLYFTQPKQARTRAARINQCVDRILQGKGLRD